MLRVLRSFVVFPALLTLAAVLPGCMSMSDGKPDGPWHEAYLPIDDPDSHAFVAECLEQAVNRFGEPVIPVTKVLLRRSKKAPHARKYRIGEDFSLTECADETNGVFVIYIAVDQDHANYFPLLGHECAHLLNPHLFDWYMEGLATLFSEEMCEATNRDWGNWKRHFERTRREPYGLSFRMMRELQTAFPEEYPAIIRFTMLADEEAGRQQIDINAWLDSLPAARRDEAVGIIGEYAPALLRKESSQYYFTAPQVLGL